MPGEVGNAYMSDIFFNTGLCKQSIHGIKWEHSLQH